MKLLAILLSLILLTSSVFALPVGHVATDIIISPTIQFCQEQSTLITASTTWTSPANTKSVTFEAWGGGGAAGGSDSGSCDGSGGGGGAYVKKTITNPSGSYAIAVGQGGQSKIGCVVSNNGQASTITAASLSVSAGGGGGGGSDANNPARLAGTAGIATGGDTNWNGNPGAVIGNWDGDGGVNGQVKNTPALCQTFRNPQRCIEGFIDNNAGAGNFAYAGKDYLPIAGAEQLGDRAGSPGPSPGFGGSSGRAGLASGAGGNGQVKITYSVCTPTTISTLQDKIDFYQNFVIQVVNANIQTGTIPQIGTWSPFATKLDKTTLPMYEKASDIQLPTGILQTKLQTMVNDVQSALNAKATYCRLSANFAMTDGDVKFYQAKPLSKGMNEGQIILTISGRDMTLTEFWDMFTAITYTSFSQLKANCNPVISYLWTAFEDPSAPTKVYLSQGQPQIYTYAGKTFSVYNVNKMYTGQLSSITESNKKTIITNAPDVNTVSSTPLVRVFNQVKLNTWTLTKQTTFVNEITTQISHELLCQSNSLTAACRINNDGSLIPIFVVDSKPYGMYTDGTYAGVREIASKEFTITN